MKPPPKPGQRYEAGDITIGLIGFAAVVAIASVTTGGTGLGAGLLFLGLVVGSFASIVIHELGHAIAAWAVGWRVWIISALPVVIRLGHTPHFSTKFSHDVGGYVLGSPPTSALDRPWRSIVFSLGGPLASVVTGPLFIYWLTTWPRAAWETPTGAGALGAMLAFGFYGVMAAAWTGWPVRGWGGRPNDMMMVITALKEPESPDTARGVAWAWALFDHGVEPSAWPVWIREGAEKSAQSPWAPPVAAMLAFASALDRGDRAGARHAAEQGRDAFGRVLRAYAAVHFDGDAGVALEPVKEDEGPEQLDWLRALSEARVLELKNDISGAERLRDHVALSVRNSGVPQPFWEKLLASV